MSVILSLLILHAAPPALVFDAEGVELPPGAVAGLAGRGKTRAFAFRPGGRVLVAAFADGVRFYGGADRRLHRVVPSPGWHQRSLVLLDGRGEVALWLSPRQGRAEAYDLRSARPLLEIRAKGFLRDAALSWDGSTVATVEEDDGSLTVRVGRTADGKRRVLFSVPSAGLAGRGRGSALALSPDGSLLAAVLEDGKAYAGLVRVATGKEATSLPAGVTRDGLMFSPEGKVLAVMTARSVVLLLDAGTGRERLSIPIHDHLSTAFALSPDGRVIAVASGGTSEAELKVVEMATGKTRLSRQIPFCRGGALAISRDGLLAAEPADGPAFFWDLTGRSDLREAGATAEAVEALASRSASEAFDAMGRLVRTGDRAVSPLRARLRPAKAPPTEAQIDALVALTCDADPAVRARAGEALVAAGMHALPALRRAVEAGGVSRPGVQRVIDDINDPPSRRALIELRGVEVLERLASPGARRLLRELAGGHPSADLTKEAKAALTRMEAK